MTLSLDYGNAVNNWFWAIDDLELTVPLAPLASDAVGTTVHVLSDVQGDTADLGKAVDRLNQLDSNAKALYLVGDLVSSGTDAQYSAVRSTLDAHPHVSGTYGYVLGNDEFYNGSPSATSLDRFLQFAGRSKVYDEKVVGGVEATNRNRLLALLSQHPNVILFTGHTHWSLDRQDWLVRETYPGRDPNGFAVVNTGAIWNVYGPSGDWGEAGISDSTEMSGLRVTSYADRVRIEAYDFLRDRAMHVEDVRIG